VPRRGSELRRQLHQRVLSRGDAGANDEDPRGEAAVRSIPARSGAAPALPRLLRRVGGDGHRLHPRPRGRGSEEDRRRDRRRARDVASLERASATAGREHGDHDEERAPGRRRYLEVRGGGA